MLLEEVWNYKFVPATTNLIDVHMGRLRHNCLLYTSDAADE